MKNLVTIIIFIIPFAAFDGDTLHPVTKEFIREMREEIRREKFREGRIQKNIAPANPTLLNGENEIPVNIETRIDAEIHSLVNPADTNNILIAPINLTYQQNQDFIRLPIFFTTDFGKSWNRSEFQAGAGVNAGGDPVLAGSADGKLYYTWLEVKGLGEGDSSYIYMVESDNKGRTFYNKQYVDRGYITNGGSGKQVDKQWLAVDNSRSIYRGRVYAAYLVLGTRPGIVVNRTGSNGKFGNRPAYVTIPEILKYQFAGIDVDLSGNVHVIFFGSDVSDNFTNNYLYHSVSSDGGENFSEPKIISDVHFPFLGASSNKPDYLPGRSHPSPQFKIDNNPESPFKGTLYAVWAANDLQPGERTTYSLPFDIFMSKSRDYGETWSEPVKINERTETFRYDCFLPSIDVTPKGAVTISWFDGRAWAYNTRVHHYIDVSYDGGDTFEGNLQVSSLPANHNQRIANSFGVGDYGKIVTTASYAIPIWSDGRTNDGNFNIYASFVALPGDSIYVERKAELSSAGVSVTNVAPNPLRAFAEFFVMLEEDRNIRIEIFDTKGLKIDTIYDGTLNAGENRFEIVASKLASGNYILAVRSGSASLTQGFTVVK
jgi:hypothetical protein